MADTTLAPEPALLRITEELEKHYLAARQEVFAFIQAHPEVITARIPVHVYTLTMRGPGGLVQGHAQIGLVDFAALAAQTPAVAAIFTKYKFPPAQFAPATMTLRKAIFAAALHNTHGWAIKDPTSVQAKNIAFVLAHAKDFAVAPDLAQVELEQ